MRPAAVKKKLMKVSSRHIGVAAEAAVAALFARSGYDVSVQYGANQPEYDLIVARGESMLKVRSGFHNTGMYAK